ncbi:transport and Golgi organization protein 1 homolog isoform X3 [Ruditapes philippinarum]|uniref:transport and Golgi organization protein 1 homolog isoform X3 n=1 Tax=Ruditapes philippinarum TaxID=129788 RepID=UPI00295B4693|nr:transport and Golgi organization protein 1 homolog isoform X3 [Ruditapes philippinarum]
MMFGSMICRLILSFAILLNLDIFTLANADKISDKRLCGDRNCQTIVSKARTLARHKPTDPAFLPFERGDLIDIYSKSAGSRQDLWGGQLNGRRGYFPRSFVREFKVENPNPQFVIDTEHHVPLEERMRGTQAPSNPRTVKQDNRQQNTPQQAHSVPVIEKKEEESKESDNKVIGEPADETDIGDETELADDEPEDRGTETGSEANLESGSQVNTETGTQNNVETGSAVNTDQLTEKETSEQKDEGKETNDVKEDPTEVDETELNDEDTEIDETETDETELEDDDDHVPDEEVKKTVEEKHEDGFIDIDKLPVDTSTDIEDDIDLDAIKEALSAEGSEIKEQEEVDSEKKENIDEMQKGPEQTDEPVDKGEEIDFSREQTVEEKDGKKEGETEIEDNTDIDDGEGGSMFGSIWSAVVSPFQKKEAENVETKKVDNEENKNVDEPLVDLGTQTVDNTVEDNKSGDTAEGEKPADGIPTDDKGTEENVKFESSEQDNIEKNEADKNAEQILDNFERTLEAMADVKEDVKDVNLENMEGDKDDLKFVDSHGDVIQDHLENEKEKVDIKQMEEIKVPEPNVNEMEQSKDFDGERPQVDSNSEDIINLRKEIDDKKMVDFEKLASGMMSILATPTYDESKTEFPSARPDEIVDENLGRGEGTTQVINTEAEISETKISVDSVTQTVQETLIEEADRNEPVKDDTRGGGVVIDGTTFDADYFGDEMTTANDQATEQIYSTPSVVDNMVQTPLHKIEPTKLFDAPLETEQTLLPPGTQQPVDNGDNKIPYNQQEEQTSTVIPENIHATETVKEEPVGQESLDVSVLGTSFGYATQKVEEIQTQPIESIIVDSQTQAVDNNETVASDIVQDMVQPSLDQNAYSTEAFISRKPLSTESASAEASTETELPNQGINTESQQVDQGGVETKQGLDQNNNQVIDGKEETKPLTDDNNNQLGLGQEGIKQTTDLNNNIPDKDGMNSQDGWTDLSREGSTEDTVTAPTTDFPEQLDPYSGVDHLYTRKVPDPDLDEELRLPDDNFMKMLEPYLKSMINMLPPSLQTVLEQEPLGLSPTLTMLVSFISTNVLALLTCVGCLCKGKKKQPGRKDPLVVIRDLEEKLFIATKEKENLEDDIQIKNKKVLEMQDELSSQQSSKGTFETDLKTIKLHNESLKKQLAEVQIELDEYKQEVTEKSQVVIYKDSELQSYLTEIQSQTKRAEDAELALQKISHNYSEREEELRLSLQQVQSLSEQIQQLETSKQQLNTQAGDWSEKVTDLTEQVEQFSSDAKRMQEDLAFKENELEVLRDCFLQVKAFQGEEEMKEDAEDAPDLGEKLKQMMDVSRVNASLRSVEEERDVIQNKLLIEVESRKELEDQVQLLKRKFESNQTDKMKAERQCQEAQTKLEVLSKYFKEKEAELTRQLGEQEVLKNQNISKLQSSDSITQELAKENETYRQQIDDLKTEISKAERDFRSQIAANEKKAHENWLATRAAERELKESRHECGMLRQKLTDLERKLMQGPPPGLIRPITHRAMPPPGMLNGPPPPPPPERPGSRGDDDYRASPIGPERLPPHPDRRLPPGPMGPRPPPPPLDAMSPPPYAIRPPFPPDRRSPPSFDRYPPPRGPRPPFPRPPPPHLRSPPPMGSNPSEHDDSKQDIHSFRPIQSSTPRKSRQGGSSASKSSLRSPRK